MQRDKLTPGQTYYVRHGKYGQPYAVTVLSTERWYPAAGRQSSPVGTYNHKGATMPLYASQTGYGSSGVLVSTQRSGKLAAVVLDCRYIVGPYAETLAKETAARKAAEAARTVAERAHQEQRAWAKEREEQLRDLLGHPVVVSRGLTSASASVRADDLDRLIELAQHGHAALQAGEAAKLP